MQTVHFYMSYSLSVSQISKCVFNLPSCYELGKLSTWFTHDPCEIWP